MPYWSRVSSKLQYTCNTHSRSSPSGPATEAKMQNHRVRTDEHASFIHDPNSNDTEWTRAVVAAPPPGVEICNLTTVSHTRQTAPAPWLPTTCRNCPACPHLRRWCRLFGHSPLGAGTGGARTAANLASLMWCIPSLSRSRRNGAQASFASFASSLSESARQGRYGRSCVLRESSIGIASHVYQCARC